MATKLHDHFKEFLRLLNDHGVEYLLIGGYAVGLYGYPRATMDLDLWISASPENARNVSVAMQSFGFPAGSVPPSTFQDPDAIFRMGLPPVRIELSTSISGVQFADCWQRAALKMLDGVPVRVIGLADLKINKQASGRHKDLDDLEHLP